ncbi:thiamine diphosphokinase [Bacillota bacterium Lsc_1132]
MIINILAGGPEELLPKLADYDDPGCLWVGVDRGVFTLIRRGIQPDLALGDFDSVSVEELREIESTVSELHRFNPVKDETDMEIALQWALEQDAEGIRIFGATGGRLDHFFANVQLLTRPVLTGIPNDVAIIDKTNIVSVKGPGRYSIKKNSLYQYVSFIPVTGMVRGLTLEGFKYPLKDCHIPLGSTLCISNELINDSGTFSFSEGILLVIRSSDS